MLKPYNKSTAPSSDQPYVTLPIRTLCFSPNFFVLVFQTADLRFFSQKVYTFCGKRIYLSLERYIPLVRNLYTFRVGIAMGWGIIKHDVERSHYALPRYLLRECLYRMILLVQYYALFRPEAVGV